MNKKTLLFFILSLGLLFSCAKRTVKVEPQDPDKGWFDVSERYSYPDFEGELVHHSFFDFDPRVDFRKKELFFVATTPKDAFYGHQMNLMSGKLHRRFKYCQEEDVWGSGRKVGRPMAHIGIVPRLIDPTGRPQQVVVYGRNRYFQPFTRTASRAQKIRIVGGVLLQYCNQYPCQVSDRWLSKIMLIAVNPQDPEFKNVRTLKDLKGQMDWEQALAFLQNSFGRNVSMSSEAPAYRATGEVGPERALRAAFDKGLLFDREQQLSMRSSCHALYNYLWFASERVRENMRTQSETPLHQVTLDQGDEWERKRIESFVEQTQGSLPAQAHRNFAAFFHNFIEKYGKSFETCSTYVRDSNININPPRHWFIAQLRAFFHLRDLGHVYVCSKRAWMPNPIGPSGKRARDVQEELKNCMPSQLDGAFDTSLTVLAGLRSSFKQHYRYIQYDSVYGGSHQKIYDWVYDNGKRLSCDKNDKQMANRPIFPEDISWKDFTPEEVKEFFKVIR